MSLFKRCPNGHYYTNDDSCPYCSSGKKKKEPIIHKVCVNGHSYEQKNEECPFCGEKEVIDTYEWGNDTLWGEGIKVFFGEEKSLMKIVVNDRVYNSFYCIWISTSRGYKDSYGIKVNKYDRETVYIKPEDKIVFGKVPMTGGQFFKMCDAIIDNQLALIKM